MYFGTFLDREGYFLDTTHFPGINEKYPFRGKGIYQITGKVVEEFEYFSLEVTGLRKLAYVHDPRIAEEARHATMGISP
jgi:predicted chitinase